MYVLGLRATNSNYLGLRHPGEMGMRKMRETWRLDQSISNDLTICRNVDKIRDSIITRRLV